MRVLLVALPGSGKTTIIEHVKKRMPRLVTVNVGSMIFELARDEMGIKTRDEMRKSLTIDQQRDLQYRTAMKIAQMKAKDMLIDTHTSVKTPFGFFPGTSEEPSHIIKPDVIVLLEYNPKDILNRRKKDRTRLRDLESEQDIEDHQMSSRYYAFSAALHAQCAVKYVNLRWKEKRPFEHTEAAADEIVKLFNLQR